MQHSLPKSCGKRAKIGFFGHFSRESHPVARLVFTWRHLWMSFFLVAIFSGIEATSQTTISSLGSSGNWYSDDTRNTSGTDLVGVLKTQYGKPGQLPTAADDIAIDLQLQFLGGPTGSTGGGTVKIIAPTSFNSAKSTLSTVNLAGFAPASDLTGGSFTANYRWYMEP
ncbi:MAG: hypothetical protein IPG32_17155 [Saprospirales bacterium]|nr:hypothetical protein [Saprospirales bacterium]